MAALLGTIRPHKLWLLATMLITWGSLAVAFRFGGDTVRRLQPRRVLVPVFLLGLGIWVLVWDDPRAGYFAAFVLSIAAALPLLNLLERRA
jgi:hypothetical protein